MCKKESSGGVVGISRGFAVFVVGPVIPGPGVDGVLGRHAVGQHEERPQRRAGLVGSVGPQPMGTRGHALQKEEKKKILKLN